MLTLSMLFNILVHSMPQILKVVSKLALTYQYRKDNTKLLVSKLALTYQYRKDNTKLLKNVY